MLARYLFYEPSQITQQFVEQLLDEGIRPNDIIVFAVKFLSKYALTNNLWLLLQCKDFLQALSEMKMLKIRDKDRLRYTKLCLGLFGILMYCEKAQYKFIDESDTSKVFSNDIRSYLVNEQNTIWGDVLSDFKDVLREEVYDLLNILLRCLQNIFGESDEIILRKSFIIVRYLLTLTPKNIFQSTNHGCKLDIIDMVFAACMLHSQSRFCSTDIASYVAVIKDLFYFKASKKDKKERVNLLFHVIYTIITKKVCNTPFDGIGIEQVEKDILEQHVVLDKQASVSPQQSANQKEQKGASKKQLDASDVARKCRFLYFFSEYDDHVGLQIKFEKERLQLLERIEHSSRMRNVDVAWNIDDEKNFVLVSKLQGRDI